MHNKLTLAQAKRLVVARFDGELRPVRGAYSMAACGAPVVMAREAADGLPAGADVRLVATLRDVVEGRFERPEPGARLPAAALDPLPEHLAAVAAQVLAAGSRVLLVGAPGAGKTMIARRLAPKLPPLTDGDAADLARIFSAACLSPHVPPVARPFRAPHYSLSAAAMLGGGSPLRPGEVTLAHRGVLFLDELPEFSGHVVKALAHALQERRATREHFPAEPAMVLGTANPCPCGYHGSKRRACHCTPEALQRYDERLADVANALGMVRVDLTEES